MDAAIYQRPADNVAGQATLTVQSGTEDPDYPAANLVDGALTPPAKLTTTTGAYVFAFNAAQRIDLVALGAHNLDAGLNVRIQGNATAAWGAPTLDELITVPAAAEDDVRPHPWLDLTDKTGYAQAGFKYWRVAIVGANTVAVAIGEIWLGALRRSLLAPYEAGAEVSDERRLIEHETDYGVPTVYDLQVRARRFKCSVPPWDPGYADMLAWHRAMRGRAVPGLWIPDPAVNDAWWVRLAKDFLAVMRDPTYHEMDLNIEEVPMGLPL